LGTTSTVFSGLLTLLTSDAGAGRLFSTHSHQFHSLPTRLWSRLMSLPSSTTRRIVIGGMVLTFVCCFWTNSAQASCGDWLADPTHSPSHAGVMEDEAPLVPCSCRGPECRSLPEKPLPTSPDQRFSSGPTEWGTLLAKLELTIPQSSPGFFQGALLISRGQTLRIERPPRG
jgi:hypothetical protein